MSNSLLTSSIITRECLMVFKNKLVFTKGVNRQYDSQFAKKGAKVGDTINIRKPARFTVTDGAALNLQNATDSSVSLTLNKRKHVGFQFTTQDLTLSIDEFRDRYIVPAVVPLANQVDVDGLEQARYSVYNSVGTPGTQPSSQADALSLALTAGQKMDEFSCPTGMRSVVLNPASQAAMVKGLAGLYNNTTQVGKQYEEGKMFDALGFGWKMGQNVNMHTTGALGGTPLIKTTIVAQGASAIAWDGGSSGGGTVTGVFKKGDVVTFGGVYAVNPVTKQSTGSLMQFVVTADADGDNSGEGSLSFSPAMYTTGASQNVSALPVDGAAILTFGHASSYASKLTPVNIAYHKDAFALGCADLELPGGVDMASRATDDESGLSLRLVRQYDINNDTIVVRLDVLYGWTTLYPEWACRIQG